MRRILIFAIVSVVYILCAHGQEFAFRIGMGFGLDMGLRIDKDLPADHTIIYQNAAVPTLEIFTKFSYKRFNYIPDFKISYATFGKGKRKADIVTGALVPEGDYISIPNQGSIYEQIHRDYYLLNTSDVTLNTMSVGSFVTYTLTGGTLGSLEAGSGFFYFRKQVNFKDYMAHDIYDYYGSTGSHITNYQTDEYIFSETVRENKPAVTHRMISHLISIPIIMQMNINTGKYVELSPTFVAYFGKDSYYSLAFFVYFTDFQ